MHNFFSLNLPKFRAKPELKQKMNYLSEFFCGFDYDICRTFALNSASIFCKFYLKWYYFLIYKF